MVNEPFETGGLEDDGASALAIEALSFIAADSLLFNRFLRLTGLELENLREAAGEPGFLAGVLDFILGDERTLDAFASQAGVQPESVSMARHRLGTIYAESRS